VNTTDTAKKMSPEELSKIKDFRKLTGYSVQDCKAALQETAFDFDKAKEMLAKKYKEKCLSVPGSSLNAEAPEFVSKVFFDEVNNIFGYAGARAKSDMVTRSEKMRDLLVKAFDILDIDIDENSGFDFLSKDPLFDQELQDFSGYYREKFGIDFIKKKKLTKGEIMANYSHDVYHKKDGNISYKISRLSAPVILKYEGELSSEDVEKIRKLAYAISITSVGANKPLVFEEKELDQKTLDDYREQKAEEAKKSGKPEKIIDGIVNGQVEKFKKESLASELALLSIENLPWLKAGDNGELVVKDAIAQTEKALNCKISVSFYKVMR
jgi:elongation factor Ts